jgi:type II secretory pathway pseudopilin PulG
VKQAGQRRQHGFTAIELLVVLAAIITIAAVVVPNSRNLLNAMKARNAARLVERQLHSARLKAVSNARAMRVRFGCPAAGQLRILEVTGVAATDTAANRCSDTAYPYPGPNDGLRSTPSMDSPVIRLPAGTMVTCVDCPPEIGSPLAIEFAPRGGVRVVNPSTGVGAAFAGDLVIRVARGGQANEVKVNVLGRARLN